MEGGWPDKTRRENSRYTPSSLQASWGVYYTRNSLLGIGSGVENTKNTILYHLIDQKCGDSGQEN